MLTLAAALERSSEHPLAAAIIVAAKAAGLAIPDATGFASVTGKGVTGMVDSRMVALGNAALMAELGVALGDLGARADALRGDGATALFAVADGQPCGVIAIADPIKATARAALDALKADRIRIIMLTGDNRTTAEAVARQLGLQDVRADVLPDDKHRIISELKEEGRIVAMAGDGVNDAPALAEADVGIAMGTGTEVAIQSAGVTLVRGDLAGIVRARTLSRATMRNIRQNLVFAFAYNAVGIPIAAGVPALTPAEVHTEPSRMNILSGSTSMSGYSAWSRSAHSQWVATLRPPSCPAAASMKAPVQTEHKRRRCGVRPMIHSTSNAGAS